MVTVEERRHQLDMIQTFKIINGKDDVETQALFALTGNQERTTRATADPSNILILAPRLEVRKLPGPKLEPQK